MPSVSVLPDTRTNSDVIHRLQPGISLLAIGLIAMGTLSIISRDFAYTWQPVPQFHGRGTVAILCGLFMIAVSVALLFRSTASIASRALFPFLIAWLCLKIPAIIIAGNIEGVWIGVGELGMLLAGGWVLFACLSGLNERALVPLHHRTAWRPPGANPFRHFGDSGWAQPHSLSPDHNQPRPLVASLPHGARLGDRRRTDPLRTGPPVLLLSAHRCPHRNRDAGFVRLPRLGS